MLHVPRSGRGFLLDVEQVKFNVVLPLSVFSESATSGSRDASVMIKAFVIGTHSVLSIFSARICTPVDYRVYQCRFKYEDGKET